MEEIDERCNTVSGGRAAVPRLRLAEVARRFRSLRAMLVSAAVERARDDPQSVRGQCLHGTHGRLLTPIDHASRYLNVPGRFSFIVR